MRLSKLCAGLLILLFAGAEAQVSPNVRVTRALLDAGGGVMAGPGRLRLRSTSLGSGVQTGPLTGRLRLTSGFVQRGAMSQPLAGDFNGDGGVDFDDFFLFANSFGSREARFDLSRDGRVDFDDFFLFAAQFGKRR
ncbi:MAG: hypothetical protein A3F84_04090 [Candidatus Handelsmanbacteria bacterium RIFCSPLOWO2_12_FULL_64_10]|uniref:EF-hand domain-containing protein n=1 Tax=Handelsmanbacteria sp. (strain RIFCSPLOWO2_12_FULL_64_10) TaxID=1817868 RepID=A0A1F6CTA9_HANXR|nr:MAG: hypothetical protein A3F84_04090 [Candidatus Handelsmanbacteria bacterium RIFCSPLOWO2_12_FULL_64_10]